ncbi:MAG: imidazole glycerol phosphate synthase subunit HisF [Acholeplasmataceae bacterium]|nr:imidazole glycerol phosphate synthase subunit HisF [Acholeplasmataceae bacterium]
MLTKRIIPCLDVRDGRVVKGQKFDEIKDVDDPVLLGAYYSQKGADELIFYDITASHEKREISLDFVSMVAKSINIPFCVGGGVETIDDFTKILRKGADKISVNSGAVKNPNLIKEASLKFGNQCVVLSIDAKKDSDGSYKVYVEGGRKKTELDAIDWAIEGVRLGAGEICINSIDEDGMKNGYDLELLSLLTKAVNVPVIASGGAGKKEHFLEALEKTDVDAVLAASVFHYKEILIQDLKNYLKDAGINVRL